MKITDAFPDADVTKLTELQYSNNHKGPWKIYIYEPNSDKHRGGAWFMEHPHYPEEGEITIRDAKLACDVAVSDGREVRICGGGDELVFHAKGKRVLYGATFWQEIGA